jgi:hypothetical protein
MTYNVTVQEIAAVQRRYHNNKEALKKAKKRLTAARREFEKAQRAYDRYGERMEKALDELCELGVRADQRTFKYDCDGKVIVDGSPKRESTKRSTVIRLHG